MKALKLLTLFAFALFLVGTASAVVVYGDWEDSSQSATITNGNSINLNVEAFSVYSDFFVYIKVYNSNSELIYTSQESLYVLVGEFLSMQYSIGQLVYQTPGNYEVIISASDRYTSDSQTLDLRVNPLVIPDTTKPVITILGANPITLSLGTAYTEYGATAIDNVDGDITGKIKITNPVNVYSIGTYIVKYNVKDVAGNSAVEVKRTVNVVAVPYIDTTAPVITITGANPITINEGAIYTELGATATDNVDGDITSKIIITGSVNAAVVGTYTITYSVSDVAKNTATATRTVNVVAVPPVDTTAPVITLLGANLITITLGNPYVDAGATATDNVDGDVTSKITTTGSVDTSVVGTYTIIYSVSDVAKNTATATRTVNVVSVPPVDTTAPVITLLGANPITITLGNPYVDAGATALDDTDGDITSSIVIVNSVDTSVVGTYTVSYNVKDATGNSAVEVTRTVNVVAVPPVDTTAPVITIVVPQASIYSSVNFIFNILTDEQSTVLYSLDSSNNVSMIETSTNAFESSLLTLSEGAHSVTFYATDTSGNTASSTVIFSVDTSNITPLTMDVITPEEGHKYTNFNMVFEIHTNKISEVEFSLDGQNNVSMDFMRMTNTMLVFEYDATLSKGSHTVTFYATDALENKVSKTVTFSVEAKKGNGNNHPIIGGIGEPIVKKPVVSGFEDTEKNIINLIMGKNNQQVTFFLIAIMLIIAILILLILFIIIKLMKRR